MLSPELPKNSSGSLVHFFHIGQFNILIVLHTGYANTNQFKNVSHVVNFDTPDKYNQYKQNGNYVEFDNGSELTLI